MQKNANHKPPKRTEPPKTTPVPVRHQPAPRYSTRSGDMERRNLTSREMRVRSKSYDDKSRSFVAVSSTETPADVFDWERFEYVQEILVADGGEFPDRCPLLDSHNRYRSVDVIGSAIEPKRVGEGWEQRGVFVEGDPEVDRIAVRVRDGHITDVSIGYEVLDFVDIPAGQTQEINGREYTAGDRTLRITTKWRVRELSITPIGADEKAKIRNQSPQGRASAPPRIIRSNAMPPRLMSYLRSLGLAVNASDDEAREFMSNLSGLERTFANMLDHAVTDSAARTACDQMIRAAGFDPADPSKPLRRGRRSRREEDSDEERESDEDEEEREDDEDEERESDEDEERESGDEEDRRRRRRRRSGRRGATSLAAGARAERERQAMLREMAGDVVPVETLDRAINEGWSVGRAGPVFLQSIRDNRGGPLGADVPAGAPAGHSRNSQTDYTRESLAAALLLRAGFNDPVRHSVRYNERTGAMRFVDASRDDAHCRAVDRGDELRGLPQVEIVRRALELGGMRVEPIPGQIVRALQTRATAASINAFVGIYTQTFGAIMLQSFEATPDSTIGWTAERENPNFLQNERHRITKGGVLTKHAKGGEAEHFNYGDTTEYVRVFRYSGQSVFDEMDLINDTLFNALRSATPDEMGESARQLRPDLVYAILHANPNLQDGAALFNTTFGNLKYSSGFDKAKLQAALTTISTRQENGRNLNLRGKYVVAPEAIKFDVVETIQSPTVIIAGDTDRTRGTMNAVSLEGLVPISDSRLDNGVTDPNSGTTYAGDADDWYVATEANRHTIEVTYLQQSGRVPQLRSGILDRGQFGIWFDVKHDIGAKALARHGLVKCTPSAAP